MDSQKRLMLALGLSFLLTLVYVTFFVKPQAEPQVVGGSLDGGAIAAATVDAGTALPSSPIAMGAASDGGAVAELPPVKTVQRDLGLIHYRFSSEGGGLTGAELQGNKMREQEQVGITEGFARLIGRKGTPPPQMNLAVPVAGQPLPLSISISGPQPLPASTRYRVIEGDEADPNKLVLSATSGTWEVTKTWQWVGADGFELLYTVALKNIGSSPAAGDLGLHYSRAIDPAFETKGSFFGGIGNESRSVCYVADSLESLRANEDPPVEHKGSIRYVGIDQQYFLSSIYPLEAPRDGRCVLTATNTARIVDAFFPLAAIAPGQVVTHRFGAFLGPKDLEMLTNAPSGPLAGLAGGGGAGESVAGAAGAAIAPVHLEKTVDFSYWAVICKVLLVVLKFFHGLFQNWGVAIILLTVLVKIVLMPLTHKALVSAEAMKALQPKMEEIKKKYPDDKERQNVETMKLYQEAKVNPLGGCLPMLFQLPIWGALFTTLRASYELYREPFINPIWGDLTYKDPTYLLPLALGVTMIVTQKLQPQMTADPMQAKIMTWVMPIFFTVLMMNYPAGLALYIFTNNLLSIAQQYALRKFIAKKGGGQPPVKKQERGGGQAQKKVLSERKA